MDVNIDDLTMRKDCTSWKWIHRVTIGTWNVEGIGRKDKELPQLLSQKFTKIAAMTEMKKKSKRKKNN